MYIYGLGVTKDTDAAIAWIQKAGTGGLAAAQYNLGKLFRDGAAGLTRNLEKSVGWFEAAAMQGHARAQERLATRYLHGERIDKDRVRAMAWYSLAADQGLSSANQNMEVHLVELSSEEADAATAYVTKLN